MSDLKLVDPKEIDGEPYEVAKFAGKQAEEALEASLATIVWFRWAARGAWMSATYHLSGTMPRDAEFDVTAVGRKLSESYEHVSEALQRQRLLTVAAAWNPKEV